MMLSKVAKRDGDLDAADKEVAIALMGHVDKLDKKSAGVGVETMLTCTRSINDMTQRSIKKIAAMATAA